MAIVVSGTDIIVNGNTPAVSSTTDLIASAAVGGLAGATVDAVNNTLTLDGNIIIVQSGGTLILDDEEGTIFTNRTIVVQDGAQLDIGRRVADFFGTNTPKQTTGVALFSTGNTAGDNIDTNFAQFLNGSTVNWYSTLHTSSAAAHLFVGTTCNITWFGGSSCISTADPGGNAARIRQNSTTATFDGTISGSTNTSPFTCIGPVRMDFFQDVATVNGGGYTAEYTAGGAFQIVNTGQVAQEFITVPGLGNIGLAENFAGDAFGGAGVRLINPSSAARYNISHNVNGGFGAASWTIMSQEIGDTIIDTGGDPIEDAFYYVSDSGAASAVGGTNQNNRTSDPPQNLTYRNPGIIDPVFGGAISVATYSGDIVYTGRSNANGIIQDEIVTRLVNGGLSGGQSSDGTAYTDNNTRTNYRFTTDNNDTASFIIAAYGQDRLLYTQDLVGLGVRTSATRTMTPDVVVATANVDAATASSNAVSDAIGTWELAIGVIEHDQTPQNDTDTVSLFRYNATTAEKAWTGLLNSAVQIPGDITLNAGTSGIVIRGVIVGAGLATTLTGNLGWDVGVNSISTDVQNFGNIPLRGLVKDLESTVAVSNVVLGGGQTSFITNPANGITFEDSETINGLTNLNGLTFGTGCTVNLSADIDIQTDVFTGVPIFAATTPRIVTLTTEQAMAFGQGSIAPGNTVVDGNITYSVPATIYTFNISNAAFRGRVAIAYRVGGITGTGAWTLVGSLLDFTTTQGTIPDLLSNDAAFQGGNIPVAITVGTGYRINITEVNPAILATTVGVSEDANYNISVTLRDNVTMGFDVIQGDFDNDGVVDPGEEGTVDIVIVGTDGERTEGGMNVSNALSGEETNNLLGRGKNDIDYIQQILDGGRTEEFITFPTPSTTSINTFSRFRKADGAGVVPQQTIQGVTTGFSSRSLDGFPDVINLPSEVGLTADLAREALNSATRLMAVEQMNNYLVSNGADGAAVADRLIGIRPKAEGFNNDGDYTIT